MSPGVIVEVPVLTLPQDAAFTIKEIDVLNAADYIPEGLLVKLGARSMILIPVGQINLEIIISSPSRFLMILARLRKGHR